MNEQDRQALHAISEQIEVLSESVSALTDKETVKAIQGLVEIAPTLKALADGYRAAGVAGNFVKWIAGIATGVVALWALFQVVMFGDGK